MFIEESKPTERPENSQFEPAFSFDQFIPAFFL
jgi:hypothetical protein